MAALRYFRSPRGLLLSTSEPRDVRLVLRVRPPDLRGVHDAGARRPALPRAFGQAAGRAADQLRGATNRLRGHRRARHQGAARAERRHLPPDRLPGPGPERAGRADLLRLAALRAGVANGDWWRLFTSAFLHANLIHIAFNMYFLWFVGAAVEQALGRGRFILLYIVSALAGSAGALVWTPTAPTVGASGALFGLLGAALILERQRNYVLGGSALALIVINLVLSFAISGISIGGHVGGLIGGILCTLVLSKFARAHAAYSRVGLWGIAGVLAVGLLSLAVAYWRVRGY